MRLTAVVLLLLAACAAEPKNVVGDAADSATNQGGTSSGPAGTSGQPSGGAMLCAQFTDRDSCFQLLDDGTTCGWYELVTYDAACGVLNEQGACLWIDGDSTDPGCGPPPGCGGDIYFRTVAGGLETLGQCGSTPPDGFEPCTFAGGEDGPYDEAACNCACEAEGASSSTGSDGGSTTGG